MKKLKTKSILACAVLASVLGAAAPVWADEVGGENRVVVTILPLKTILNPVLVDRIGFVETPYFLSPSDLFVAGFIGSPQMNLDSSIFNFDGSTLILDNVGKIKVTAKSADSRAVLTMGNGALTYLNFANDGGIEMNITNPVPEGQFNYYVAEGRDNSLTVLRNLQNVTINNTPVTVNADFWQCLKTADGAQIVVVDGSGNVVAADAAHWGTESHGEDIGHFYRPIANETKDNVQSMTALGFGNSNVIALNAETANASATFGSLDGSLRSVNFGTGDACAVSATGGKTATLTDVSCVNVNASDGNANFISVSGGGNISVNGKDDWAMVDVKSEKKDANFVFAKDGTNTVNVNGVDAMLYPGTEGKAYVAQVKAGETTLNLKDSSVSGNLNTNVIGLRLTIPFSTAQDSTFYVALPVVIAPVVKIEQSQQEIGYLFGQYKRLQYDGQMNITKLDQRLMATMIYVTHDNLSDAEQAWGWSPIGFGIAAPVQLPWGLATSNFAGISKSGAYVTPDEVYLKRRQLEITAALKPYGIQSIEEQANGPTAIFLTGKSGQTALLGPIADDGCLYMVVLPFVYLPELTNPVDGKMAKRGSRIFGPVARALRERDFINPYDVETLEVHKDAAATAIFGSYAANSVPVYALYGVNYYTPAYVQAEEGATLNLNLDNSLLMAGVNSFENHGTVNMKMTNSNWVMQDDSNVKRLSMDDKSEVIFDRDSWKYLTLNVDEYQGNGNFILNADLGYGGVISDKLVIKKALVQNAIGGSDDPVLNLYVLTDDNPLTDPNTKAEVLTLGEDAEDLQINLITDNIPDNGLWRYAPEWSKDENNNSTLSFGLKRGDELSTVGRAVTGGVIDTQVWYQESDAVFDRVRNPSVSCCATDSPPDVGHETGEQGSVWASYTHSKNTYDNSIKAITSVANQGGIEKRYNGAVVGYDQCIATYPEHNAALYMGGLIGYGEGRNSWSGGNSELDGKGIGIYAGYKTHKGAYLTALAKYNQYNMDVKGYGYNEVKDDYRLHSFGVSINAGRRYAKDLNRGFYLEPQAELGYVNYGNDNYELKGIKVEMQETKSCRGRLGLQFGTHNGRADVYGRVSYLKDFQGDSDIMTHYLNGTRDSIKVEQGGHWWNFALGGTFTNGKNLSADVSLNLDRGDHDSKLGFRVGLNWAF